MVNKYKPGDFSFLDGRMKRTMKDMYELVTTEKLWDWFKNNDPPKETGYTFWKHDNIDLLSKKEKFGHSGISFGFTLKDIHYIAKNGWDSYVKICTKKNNVNNNLSD